jgi:hypothetical protein
MVRDTEKEQRLFPLGEVLLDASSVGLNRWVHWVSACSGRVWAPKIIKPVAREG